MSAVTEGVILGDGWLRVVLPGGHADFHYRWLRHQCPAERHPITGERTLCSSEVADDVRPRSVERTDSVLRVVWEPDGHASEYDFGWLAEHAYARDRAAAPPPPSSFALLEVDGGGTIAAAVDQALARLCAHGAALVRRRAARPEEETEAIIDAFKAHGYAAIPTHFGRIEDLRTDNTTNQNTDQLGYTDAPVHLHTDQPFLERPPRLQLLQGIRSADEGGDSLALQAAFRRDGRMVPRARPVLPDCARPAISFSVPARAG